MAKNLKFTIKNAQLAQALKVQTKTPESEKIVSAEEAAESQNRLSLLKEDAAAISSKPAEKAVPQKYKDKIHVGKEVEIVPPKKKALIMKSPDEVTPAEPESAPLFEEKEVTPEEVIAAADLSAAEKFAFPPAPATSATPVVPHVAHHATSSAATTETRPAENKTASCCFNNDTRATIFDSAQATPRLRPKN